MWRRSGGTTGDFRTNRQPDHGACNPPFEIHILILEFSQRKLAPGFPLCPWHHSDIQLSSQFKWRRQILWPNYTLFIITLKLCIVEHCFPTSWLLNMVAIIDLFFHFSTICFTVNTEYYCYQTELRLSPTARMLCWLNHVSDWTYNGQVHRSQHLQLSLRPDERILTSLILWRRHACQVCDQNTVWATWSSEKYIYRRALLLESVKIFKIFSISRKSC